MDRHRRVLCPDNQDLANYMLDKWRELSLKPKGISDNLEKTLTKAYSSLCDFRYPIRTLKDLSLVKGVGKWILRLLQDFFQTDVGAAETEGSDSGENIINKGKNTKATRRYVPQKNSVAYALLITLYRETSTGTDFMRKQELIDATEASGLSRAPIVAEKGKGKPRFGSSPREWYTGWSCMKTLISKGLVVKSSNPAKYMLTQEGKEIACECLKRSGLAATVETSVTIERVSNLDGSVRSDTAVDCSSSANELPLHSIVSNIQMNEIEVPPEAIQRFTCMGFSKEQVLCAYAEVSKTTQHKDIISLWPAVLCHLREEKVYGLREGPEGYTNNQKGNATGDAAHGLRTSYFSGSVQATSTLMACSSSDYSMQKSHLGSSAANPKALALPPLRPGERFEDIYKVILILDDREQFATRGSRAAKIIENIRSQFKIQVEVRHLPVGDGIWIARHKQLDDEYVLDFVVERKTVDDLCMSIRDSRYKDQKLRLLRCGLKKLIYLVEGDPNSSEASESIKTACFTTEILEGFDVHRTSGLTDTLRKYGHLTQAITQYYKLQLPEDEFKNTEACLSFDEFIKRCGELDKMTVGDVYAIQLMQVPHVTEEVALAVLDLYPTLVSLARAYFLLEGDVSAQEDMLRKQSKNAIKAAASKNIFQLVWGN